jgi:glycosyltransferase involved in cell wall biosynthesis
MSCSCRPVTVSIIMPAYNAAGFISESIASVISQDWQDWELIVVDDGSNDGTADIVNEFHDPRIHLIQQANAGVSAARNVALDHLQGEFVVLLDSDDLLAPHSLRVRVEFLQAHPEVGIVDGMMHFCSQALDQIIRVHQPICTIRPFFSQMSRLDPEIFALPFYMFRHSLVGTSRFQVGLSHLEDILFFLEISAGKDVLYGAVPELVCLYRTGHVSAMSNLDGIEKGYMTLLSKMTDVLPTESHDLQVARWRVAKIMFLSWMRRRQPARAIRSSLAALTTGRNQVAWQL